MKTLLDYPDLLKELHLTKNGLVDVSKISYGSGRRLWWQCEVCGYEWETLVKNRTINNNNCLPCSIKNRVDLEKNNFSVNASPQLLIEWHTTKNVGIDMEKISYKSNVKVWWQCSTCDREWETAIRARTIEGRNCFVCESLKQRRFGIDESKKIIELRNNGMKVDEICGIYQTRHKIIYQILNGDYYPELDRPKNLVVNLKDELAKLPPLTESQLDIITGSLLGDAYITKFYSGVNSKFEKEQCLNSEEHIEWLFDKLNPYSLTIEEYENEGIHEICGRRINTGPSLAFKTHNHPIFTEMRKKWYVETDVFMEKATKIVPKDLVLNPQIVAVWFHDDGSKLGYGVKFCTDGFTIDEVAFLQDRLKKDLGLDSVKWFSRGNPIIAIPARHYLKFIEIVKPFYPWECTNYKIDVSHFETSFTGKRQGFTKLTKEQVKEIVQLYPKKNISELAILYKVQEWIIRNILRGKTWGICVKMPKELKLNNGKNWLGIKKDIVLS